MGGNRMGVRGGDEGGRRVGGRGTEESYLVVGLWVVPWADGDGLRDEA